MIISFTAPYPPTTNKIWRKFNGHMVLSQEARAYKATIEALARDVDNGFQSHDLVGVTLHVYRPRKTGDIDNVAKLILDGMQGVTYPNDNQVIELHIYRGDDKANPRIEVQVIGISTKPVKVTRKRTKKVL